MIPVTEKHYDALVELADTRAALIALEKTIELGFWMITVAVALIALIKLLEWVKGPRY